MNDPTGIFYVGDEWVTRAGRQEGAVTVFTRVAKMDIVARLQDAHITGMGRIDHGIFHATYILEKSSIPPLAERAGSLGMIVLSYDKTRNDTWHVPDGDYVTILLAKAVLEGLDSVYRIQEA